MRRVARGVGLAMLLVGRLALAGVEADLEARRKTNTGFVLLLNFT